MMNPIVYFNDYYNRRASSGKVDVCMKPTSSTFPEKSQSLNHLNEKGYEEKDHTVEFLEFSKTANYRSRRDAVFEPLGTASKTHLVISSGASHAITLSDATNELGRVSVTTAAIDCSKKRKATANGIEVEAMSHKKLKNG